MCATLSNQSAKLEDANRELLIEKTKLESKLERADENLEERLPLNPKTGKLRERTRLPFKKSGDCGVSVGYGYSLWSP
jgi:hypothetical protein